MRRRSSATKSVDGATPCATDPSQRAETFDSPRVDVPHDSSPAREPITRGRWSIVGTARGELGRVAASVDLAFVSVSRLDRRDARRHTSGPRTGRRRADAGPRPRRDHSSRGLGGGRAGRTSRVVRAGDAATGGFIRLDDERRSRAHPWARARTRLHALDRADRARSFAPSSRCSNRRRHRADRGDAGSRRGDPRPHRRAEGRHGPPRLRVARWTRGRRRLDDARRGLRDRRTSRRGVASRGDRIEGRRLVSAPRSTRRRGRRSTSSSSRPPGLRTRTVDTSAALAGSHWHGVAGNKSTKLTINRPIIRP